LAYGPEFDPYSALYQEDPYPILRAARQAARIFWSDVLEAFVVTRYDDVRSVIMDDQSFLTWPPNAPPRLRTPSITLMDGEAHHALRLATMPNFTRRLLEETIPPVLGAAVDGLVASFIARGSVELVQEFANPIPAKIIGHLTGVAETETPGLPAEVERMLEADASPHISRLQSGVEETRAFFGTVSQSLIERERSCPSGTLISKLLSTDVAGRPMTEAEVASFVVTLIVAGIETTQRLIANLAFVLADNMELQAQLRADETLIAQAIEETLRLYPPNQFRMRYAAHDQELLGQTLKAGDKVFAMIASANHDDDVYENPEQFVLARFKGARERGHLAFGMGPHLCMGSALARMETETAIRTLLRRLKRFSVADGADVAFHGFRNRSPVSLPLQFEAA
jgi:cytochrome P450